MDDPQMGPGGYRRKTPQNAPEPDSLRTHARALGVSHGAISHHLRSGKTLDEAVAFIKAKQNRPPPKQPKTPRDESFHDYFVDALRGLYGLAPLYNRQSHKEHKGHKEHKEPGQ